MAKAGSAQKKSLDAAAPKGAASKNVDRGVWQWIEKEKGKIWETPLIPEGDVCIASVKRSFSKELDGTFKFYAYRNGRILGRRDTEPEAKKLCISGKADPRDDAVMFYVRNHSQDIPMFLRLSEKERQQVREHYRYDAPAQSRIVAYEKAAKERGYGNAADVKDPSTLKLLAELAAKTKEDGVAPGKRASAKQAPGGRPAKVRGPATPGGGKKPTKAERDQLELDPKAKLSRARDGNPKKEGTEAYPRWALMFEHCDKGSTVAQYEKAGGNITTLKNAIFMGWAKVEGK